MLSLEERKPTMSRTKGSVRTAAGLPAMFRHGTARRSPAGAVWAVIEAHEAGLSARQIAAATGLSSIHRPTRCSPNESQDVPLAS